ncbi:molybdopterin molybdotransferase MoeA [Halomonas sp. WWR20]
MSCDAHAHGLLGVEQAVTLLLERARPLNESEKVDLAQARGRILAQDVGAQLDIPGWDNSAMDGYALCSRDVGEGRDSLPVGQRIPAGSAPAPLPADNCARIFTGAPIPEGADCVVPQERCQVLEDGRVRFLDPVIPGSHIRRRGEELRRGEPLLARGTWLDSAALGVLASQGLVQVEVVRRLRVALLSTGDELVEPGQPLHPGQLYNSNRVVLSAELADEGIELIDLGVVEDTFEAVCAALQRAQAEADVIVTTGGVSVGEEDHVRGAVDRLGGLHFHGVAMKPGKPFAFGWVGETPLLGLPGNPVASLVTWQRLARPYLRRCQGRSPSMPLSFPVVAGFSRPLRAREEVLRVTLRQGVAHLAGGQGSAMLSVLTRAEGYLVIPAGREVREGWEYDFVPFARTVL